MLILLIDIGFVNLACFWLFPIQTSRHLTLLQSMVRLKYLIVVNSEQIYTDKSRKPRSAFTLTELFSSTMLCEIRYIALHSFQ